MDKAMEDWTTSKANLGVSDKCSVCTNGHYGNPKDAVFLDEAIANKMSVKIQICDTCTHIRLFLS